MSERNENCQIDPQIAFDGLMDDPDFSIRDGSSFYADDLIRLFDRRTEIITKGRLLDTIIYGRDKSDPGLYLRTVQNLDAFLREFRVPLIFSESLKTHSYLPGAGLQYDQGAIESQNPWEVVSAATSEVELHGLSRKLNFGIVGIGEYTERFPVSYSYDAKGQLIPPWKNNEPDYALEVEPDYATEDKELLERARTLSQGLMLGFSGSSINAWLGVLDYFSPHTIQFNTHKGLVLGENLDNYLVNSPDRTTTSENSRREDLFGPVDVETPWENETYVNGRLVFDKMGPVDVYSFSGNSVGSQTPLNRLRIRFNALCENILDLRTRISPLIIITDNDFSRYVSRSGLQKYFPSMGVVIEEGD